MVDKQVTQSCSSIKVNYEAKIFDDKLQFCLALK